jgi:hypothetical protein
VNDELPDRLRVTAEEFEPDRDRMWSRVSEGMREPRVRAEPVRMGWRIPQLALATGAAVVLIGAVMFFGHAMGLGPEVGPTLAPPAAGPGIRTAEATDPASTGDPTASATSEGSEETAGGETPGGEGTSDGSDGVQGPEWLWTDGSVDPGSNQFWSQANLTLKNGEALAELTVVLRIAVGDGVESTGSWNTANSYFTDAVVTEEDGFLVYRWTLREGQVLPAGEYVLAGQHNHRDGPRSADEDSYTFAAATESGDNGDVVGDFE